MVVRLLCFWLRLVTLTLAISFFFSLPLAAIPLNSQLFCASYPQSSACDSGQTVCKTCHVAPPELNAYGRELARGLRAYPDFDKSVAAFSKYLGAALLQIDASDSDSDGTSNGQEIALGRAPGESDASEVPLETYDPALALRRLHLLFCGRSPDYISLQQKQISASMLHTQLDQCLRSDFWRQLAVPRLADEKIRPNRAIGRAGEPFVIGDYDYDYRLFTYIITEGRDLRELLSATYHIDALGQRVEGPIADQRIPGKIVIGNGQPLEVGRRYGMITSQWFISLNTMFAELPRNTAAQAYRAYLGLDLARSEGLYPVANEPRDVDHKGVGEAACAVCHSTLDPLAYAFSPYVGLRSGSLPVGSYNPAQAQWETWGHLFGEPTADLGAWVARALESEAFQKNVSLMLFQYAIGHAPETPTEKRDFENLWRRLPALDYSAPALLHEMIDTLSFAGRP